MPDYPGPGKAGITLTIPDGASLDEIGGILVDADVVKSLKAWNEAVDAEERATSVQAGRYLMKTQMKATDALGLLINPGGSRVRLQFTIPEGLRLTAQVDALVKGTKIKKSAFEAALKKPKRLGLPRYANNNPEGSSFRKPTSSPRRRRRRRPFVRWWTSTRSWRNRLGWSPLPSSSSGRPTTWSSSRAHRA